MRVISEMTCNDFYFKNCAGVKYWKCLSTLCTLKVSKTEIHLPSRTTMACLL